MVKDTRRSSGSTFVHGLWKSFRVTRALQLLMTILSFCLCYHYWKLYYGAYTFVIISDEEFGYGSFPEIEVCTISPLNPVKLALAGKYFPLELITEPVDTHKDSPPSARHTEAVNTPLEELLSIAEWEVSDLIEELKIDGQAIRFSAKEFAVKKSYGPAGLCFSLGTIFVKNISLPLEIKFRTSVQQLSENWNLTMFQLVDMESAGEDEHKLVKFIAIALYSTSWHYIDYVFDKTDEQLLNVERLVQVLPTVNLTHYRVELLGRKRNAERMVTCHRRVTQKLLSSECLTMNETNLHLPLLSYCNVFNYKSIYIKSELLECAPKATENYWAIEVQRKPWDGVSNTLKFHLGREVKIFKQVESYNFSKFLLDIGNILSLVLGMSLIGIRFGKKMRTISMNDFLLKMLFGLLKTRTWHSSLIKLCYLLFLCEIFSFHALILGQKFFFQTSEEGVSFHIETDSVKCHSAINISNQDDTKPWLAAVAASYSFHCKFTTESTILRCVLDEFVQHVPHFLELPVCDTESVQPLPVYHILHMDAVAAMKNFDLNKTLEHCRITPKSHGTQDTQTLNQGCLIPYVSVYWSITGFLFFSHMCGLLGFYFGISFLGILSVLSTKRCTIPCNISSFVKKFFCVLGVLAVGAFLGSQIWPNVYAHPILTKKLNYGGSATVVPLSISVCPYPQYDLSCWNHNNDSLGNMVCAPSSDTCWEENLAVKHSVDNLFDCGHSYKQITPKLSLGLQGWCVTCEGVVGDRSMVGRPEQGSIMQKKPFPKEYQPSSLTFVVSKAEEAVAWDGKIDLSYTQESTKFIEVENVAEYWGFGFHSTETHLNCQNTCFRKKLSEVKFCHKFQNSTVAQIMQLMHEVGKQDSLEAIHKICEIQCRHARYTSFKGLDYNDFEQHWTKSGIRIFISMSNMSWEDVSLDVFSVGKAKEEMVIEDAYTNEQLASDMTGLVTIVFGISVLSTLKTFWKVRICKLDTNFTKKVKPAHATIE